MLEFLGLALVRIGARPHQLLLWVRTGLSRHRSNRSAPEGEADEIGAKADIGIRMSAVRGEADVPATWP